jgi:hypothetical protein
MLRSPTSAKGRSSGLEFAGWMDGWMLTDGLASGLADHSFISLSSVKLRKVEAVGIPGCMKTES